MDFKQFIQWSQNIEDGSALRLCETRLATAFSSIAPQVKPGSGAIHRCDLVRLWAKQRGLEGFQGTVLAGEGVRHALSVLFRRYAGAGETVAVPSDVYPVYRALAKEAGLNIFLFRTFPEFDPRLTLDDLGAKGIKKVLFPKPLKLQGRDWSREELFAVKQWLKQDGERRVLLDAVYTTGLPYGDGTLELLDTGQVLLLDSLSKGWLHEWTFGATAVPEQDARGCAELFKTLTPEPAKLALAHALLTQHGDFPRQLEQAVALKRTQAQERLKPIANFCLPVEKGYLIPVRISAVELLKRYRIVGIPLSVFGAEGSDWSVLSVLG